MCHGVARRATCVAIGLLLFLKSRDIWCERRKCSCFGATIAWVTGAQFGQYFKLLGYKCTAMANDCKKKKTKTSGTTRKAKSVPGKGCKEVETDESGPDTRGS